MVLKSPSINVLDTPTNKPISFISCISAILSTLNPRFAKTGAFNSISLFDCIE